MKVRFNMIKTGCILISQAVTVPNLMMMTSIVSEESLARDRRTDKHPLDFSLAYPKTVPKSLKT